MSGQNPSECNKAGNTTREIRSQERGTKTDWTIGLLCCDDPAGIHHGVDIVAIGPSVHFPVMLPAGIHHGVDIISDWTIGFSLL
jgi:hypothetical protein